MMKSKPNHLLEGSILKSILMISFPIILANILQTVYQLIDTFWVGRLGAKAVASVSLSFPILFFLIFLGLGFAMGGSILIAQYNGRGDKEKVSLATGQTLALVSFIAIILSVVGYFSSEFILSFLTNDATVLADATKYLKISFLGLVSMSIYMIFQSSLRGIGEVKFPLYVIAATVVANFFLDPLLMFGWKFVPAMGVSGVAFATIITQTFSAMIGLFVLVRGNFGIELKKENIKLKKSWVKRIVKLGLPSSIEHSSRSLGMFLMIFIVSTFGTLIVASYGIGTRILSFVIIPAIGFSVATSALVGNNLGARQHERAERIIKTSAKISFSILAVVGIVLFIFAGKIAGFFVPNDTELIKITSLFIKIMSLTFGLVGIQMVILGAIKAAGKTTTSMTLSIIHSLVLVGLCFFLSKVIHLNELGIWMSYPLANIISLSLAIYVYKKKEWMKKEII